MQILLAVEVCDGKAGKSRTAPDKISDECPPLTVFRRVATPDTDASWVNGRTEFEKVRHF
jgi:hypothetical protein